jgi:hypothetical protein
VLLAGSLVLAACGSQSAQPHSDASASSTAASPSAPSSTANPLAGLDATGIAADAAASVKQASSVHLTSVPTSAAGQAGAANLTVSGSDCEGTIGEPGTSAGSFRLVWIGPTAWVKPDAQLRARAAAAHAPMGKAPADVYLKTSTASKALAGLSYLCDQDQLTTTLDSVDGATKAQTTTIDGQPALALTNVGYYAATMYVSTTAPIRLLRVRTPGQGYVDFTDYNAPVTFTAPASVDTVNGSEYGLLSITAVVLGPGIAHCGKPFRYLGYRLVSRRDRTGQRVYPKRHGSSCARPCIKGLRRGCARR